MKEMKMREFFSIALVAVIMVIVLSVLLIAGTVKVESVWFVSSLMTIRVTTVITAMFSFMLVLFLKRKKNYKAFYYALLAVIFSMGLFETVWYYTAAGLRGYPLRLFEFGALFGWILLGVREAVSKRPSRLSLLLYVVFISTVVLWVATGFNFNDIGNSTFSISGEILNVVSKASIALAYALHIGIDS